LTFWQKFLKKFAAGVVDNGGNLPPTPLTPVANLPTVSTTPAELVAKFAAVLLIPGANLPPVSLIPRAILPPVSLTRGASLPLVLLLPVVHLDLRISTEFSKKFEMIQVLFSGAWGQMSHEKKN
jgi:hypothetical protein